MYFCTFSANSFLSFLRTYNKGDLLSSLQFISTNFAYKPMIEPHLIWQLPLTCTLILPKAEGSSIIVGTASGVRGHREMGKIKGRRVPHSVRYEGRSQEYREKESHTWIRLVQEKLLFSTDQPCILVNHGPSKTKVCFRWRKHLRLHFLNWLPKGRSWANLSWSLEQLSYQFPLMNREW